MFDTETRTTSSETGRETGPGERGSADGLDRVPVGVALAARLDGIELDRLSGAERLAVLRAEARLVAHHQARVFEAMASIVEAVAEECSIDQDDPMGRAAAVEEAAAEIRVALRLTRRAADRDLEMAILLRTRLPGVLAAMAEGRIDRRRAGVLVHETVHLPVAEARRIAGVVLPDADQKTTGQLRHRIRRLCMAVDPDAARARYRSAIAERRVSLEATDAGAADLAGWDLPADRAAEARARIEAMARRLKGPGESRTLDQLRADVFLDLLRGVEVPGADRASRGTIDLTVDLGTLAGLDEAPGELRGFGPVIADVARQIAEDRTDAHWRFAVTAGDSVVATGTTRRRPSAAVRRAVTLRQATCVFPGCRHPATASDLDHRQPWADRGPTTEANLAPLCRHDHRLRHAYGWRYRRLDDGGYEWSSPLGQTVTAGGVGGMHPP